MKDAIDAAMHARPGDAELILWLLVLDSAPQHVATEFRSIMRDTQPLIKLCHVQRNFTAYTHPLDRAYMRAFKSSIRSEVAKHFAEFFLEAESNFERANLDSSTSVLRQLLLSFVHTAAQNADSPQHRAAGWRFIDWNEVEQRELLAEAKRLLGSGELFPRGTVEEPHAPDAEAEATDSEPEAHVLEPLADDHSSDGDHTPTGVEESAAHHHDSTLPLCRSQNELGVTSTRVHVRVNRVVVVCCCFPAHPFYLCNCGVHSSRFSPVPQLALRMGSNDQCDGNQCCPSFGGCLRWYHTGVEPAAQCASTRENSLGSDMQ